MIKKIVLSSILFLAVFLFTNGCKESVEDVTYKIYQNTILELQQKNDSLLKVNKALLDKLYNCEHWIKVLESDSLN